ncbi:hypothetical protein MKK55_08990 [Methylobacterium sp. J-059]|uniref:hypothetical protein n=1 Tax=Methylobacterium sp. J-059 TaxID=2836643 RepID=UPI001FB9E072|nr:hypothetical protein [Methylobacterium sp. J-059]MCJ2039086.1 hypothetical protein [Methylobacterium sp. J-059]
MLKDECTCLLRSLIEKAQREDLGAAQNAILRFAMSQSEPQARAAAMDDLLSDLAGEDGADSGSDLQKAFRTVLVSMIERTKITVGPGSPGHAR